MSAPEPRMPWEQQEDELTEGEIKQQLARALATGALQAARKSARDGDHDRPNELAGG